MATLIAEFNAGSAQPGYYVNVKVWLDSQSIDTNTSTGHVDIVAVAGGGKFDLDVRSWSCSGSGTSAGTIASGSAAPDFSGGSFGLASGATWAAVHSADGTKSISFAFSWAGTVPGGWFASGFSGASGTIALPTIPRSTTPTFSINPVVFGDSVTIDLSSRASSSFTHEISYAFGALTSQTAGLAASTGVATSTTFTPPLELLRQMVALNTKQATITVVTKNGSTTIGTKTALLTLQAPNSTPYVLPTITATVERTLSDGTPDEEGTCLTVHLDAVVGSIDTGTEQNDLSYTISARPRGTDDWYELDTDTAGAIFLIDDLTFVEWDTAEEFALAASYEVKIDVEDELGAVATMIRTLAPATAIADWHRSGVLSLGSLAVPENGGRYQEEGLPLVPPGTIWPYAGTAAPSADWHLADGTALDRDDYSILFDAIGTTYGVGDGSTTFNLPNLKGRIPVGKDASQTEFDTLGETGGAKTHTLTTDEMPAHSHTYGRANDANVGGGSALFPADDVPLGPDASSTVGGGGAHNNLQPYVVLNYIIRVR